MGKSDELKCTYTLPKKYNGVDVEVNFNDLSYRTQSLEKWKTSECESRNYILDEGGTLCFNDGDEKKRVNYFGNLSFYTFVPIVEGESGWWVEFMSKIAYGVCLKTKLTRFYMVKQNGVDIVQ
jgi:hypothetical protein